MSWESHMKSTCSGAHKSTKLRFVTQSRRRVRNLSLAVVHILRCTFPVSLQTVTKGGGRCIQKGYEAPQSTPVILPAIRLRWHGRRPPANRSFLCPVMFHSNTWSRDNENRNANTRSEQQWGRCLYCENDTGANKDGFTVIRDIPRRCVCVRAIRDRLGVVCPTASPFQLPSDSQSRRKLQQRINRRTPMRALKRGRTLPEVGDKCLALFERQWVPKLDRAATGLAGQDAMAPRWEQATARGHFERLHEFDQIVRAQRYPTHHGHSAQQVSIARPTRLDLEQPHLHLRPILGEKRCGHLGTPKNACHSFRRDRARVLHGNDTVNDCMVSS